jgi:hypothetical protein
VDDSLDLFVDVLSSEGAGCARRLERLDRSFGQGHDVGLGDIHRLDDGRPFQKDRASLSCSGSREQDLPEVQLVGALDRLGEVTLAGQAERFPEAVLGRV